MALIPQPTREFNSNLRNGDCEKVNAPGSRKVVTDKDLEQFLPTGVQKSYFMLSDAERAILNTALEKYRAGQSEPILIGDKKMLKAASRLMTYYRLKIEEVLDGRAVTSYTHWVDAVQVMGAENEQVCVTFSPRFEHIWLESKELLLDSLALGTTC